VAAFPDPPVGTLKAAAAATLAYLCLSSFTLHRSPYSLFSLASFLQLKKSVTVLHYLPALDLKFCAGVVGRFPSPFWCNNGPLVFPHRKSESHCPLYRMRAELCWSPRCLPPRDALGSWRLSFIDSDHPFPGVDSHHSQQPSPAAPCSFREGLIFTTPRFTVSSFFFMCAGRPVVPDALHPSKCHIVRPGLQLRDMGFDDVANGLDF